MKSVSNFQSVPGMKSTKTMLRQPSNERNFLKPTAISRERSLPKRDQVSRSKNQMVSASMKNLRNTGSDKINQADHQVINHRNRKSKLGVEAKGSTVLDSSPTHQAESSIRMDERVKKRQQ